jgi:Ca2+-binding EF-hand superfamily protein
MRDLFNILDKDKDGVVTTSDLNSMLNSLGPPEATKIRANKQD